jgi:replicative DNA helicase
VLAKASGDHTGWTRVRWWVRDEASAGRGAAAGRHRLSAENPVQLSTLEPETEVTTYLTQGLKEMAMALGVQVIAIAASDRVGLKSKRMRLSDLRGSSALQYEADIGLILNNKFAILSREHMIYNPSGADAMRNWVVISVEKNRADETPWIVEFQLDACIFGW